MTKYRQTFVIESHDPIPTLHRVIAAHPGFQEPGEQDGVAWTAPELIVDVPNGVGAVVVGVDGGIYTRVAPASAEDHRLWISQLGDYSDDRAIAHLLAAGGDIKSHGVDL